MEKIKTNAAALKLLSEYVREKLDGAITSYNFIQYLLNECELISIEDIPDEYLKKKYLKENPHMRKGR